MVNSPYKRRIKIEKRLNKDGFPYKDSITYRFSSCSLPYFQKLMRKWYTLSGEIDKRGRTKKTKIVPKDLKLTLITFAYWIAGDGSFNKKGGYVIICTNSFEKAEVIFLAELIFKNFGIKAVVFSRSKRLIPEKKEYMIRFTRSEVKKIQELISKVLFKTMLYRIGVDL